MADNKPLSFFSKPLLCCLCVALISLAGCGGKTNIPVYQGPPTNNLVEKLSRGAALSAKSQLGIRYRLGGSSPKEGFDCSGLIYWAYAQQGVLLPRRTVEQARMGHVIQTKEMRPGDIVVFRVKAAPNGLHTALYMGNGDFIHSPNSKSKVRIENLSSPYWSKVYWHSRRIAPVLVR